MEKSMKDIKEINVTLRNKPGSLLGTHYFNDKVKKEIRDKQAKKAKEKKGERFPEQEFLDARYMDDKGRECVPVTALKKAMVSAGRAMDDMTMTSLRQSIFVDSVSEKGAMLVPIETWEGAPAVGVMREDGVTIGQGTRGLAYRPSYAQWQLKIHIEFNSNMVSEEQVLALIDQAGWGRRHLRRPAREEQRPGLGPVRAGGVRGETAAGVVRWDGVRFGEVG